MVMWKVRKDKDKSGHVIPHLLQNLSVHKHLTRRCCYVLVNCEMLQNNLGYFNNYVIVFVIFKVLVVSIVMI